MGMAQREALPQVVGHVVPLGQRHGATGQAVLEGRLVDAVVGALALGAVEHRVAGGPLVAVGVVPHHIGDGGLGNLYEAAVAALQRMAGLQPDGVTGKQTWRFLTALYRSATRTAPAPRL